MRVVLLSIAAVVVVGLAALMATGVVSPTQSAALPVRLRSGDWSGNGSDFVAIAIIQTRCGLFYTYSCDKETTVLRADLDHSRMSLESGFAGPVILDWSTGTVYERTDGAWTAERTGLRGPGDYLGFHVDHNDGHTASGSLRDGTEFSVTLSSGKVTQLHLHGADVQIQYGEQDVPLPTDASRIAMGLAGFPAQVADSTLDSDATITGMRGAVPPEWLRFQASVGDKVVQDQPVDRELSGFASFTWTDKDNDGLVSNGDALWVHAPPAVSKVSLVDTWSGSEVRGPQSISWAGEHSGPGVGIALMAILLLGAALSRRE